MYWAWRWREKIHEVAKLCFVVEEAEVKIFG